MNQQQLNEPRGASTKSKEPYAVRAHRADRVVKLGLLRIHTVLLNDFDNAFEKIFPEATESEQLEIEAAMSWIEQYLPNDGWELI